jgi:hypothetical protein
VSKRLAETIEGRIDEITDPLELDGMAEQLTRDGRMNDHLRSRIEIRRLTITRNGSNHADQP